MWCVMCDVPDLTFNRPGVAGKALQTPLSLIDWLIHSFRGPFSSKFSTYHYPQTVRAKEMKFWENVHTTPSVTCDVSQFICHMSHIRCHMSCCNLNVLKKKEPRWHKIICSVSKKVCCQNLKFSRRKEEEINIWNFFKSLLMYYSI